MAVKKSKTPRRMSAPKKPTEKQAARAPAAAKPAKKAPKKPPQKAPKKPRRGEITQIVPGYWYYVLQKQPVGIGAKKEVGLLQVTSRGGGAARETWYLYVQNKPSGGGPSRTDPRYAFQQPGSPPRPFDELYLNQSPTSLSQPTGIISDKIVAECAAPVRVGP